MDLTDLVIEPVGGDDHPALISIRQAISWNYPLKHCTATADPSALTLRIDLA
jgi:hypothetical protein